MSASNDDSDWRVHLIYSEPRKEKLEDRYFVYGIAMTPFALNIPAEKVDFTVNLAIIRYPDAVQVSANELANERSDDSPYFPIGYHEYFKSVCSRATGVQEIWDVPPCALRIITGEGYPHGKCGKLHCEGQEILFQELGNSPASVLTVFDICNAQFAVAALDGFYVNYDEATAESEPKKRWDRRLRGRADRVDNCSALFCCDNDDFTYAFRVAETIVAKTPPPDSFRGMSKPFGDAVALSVLVAVWKWSVEKKYSLDHYFLQQFRAIHTNFLTSSRAPVSRLESLQSHLEEGKVSVKEDAFQCKLFENADRWYFTLERMPQADGYPDSALSTMVGNFVVDSLCIWHTSNPGHEDKELPEALEAWESLRHFLGVSLLSTTRLERDEEGKVQRDEDGIPLSIWATSCKDMPRILQLVLNLHASGSMFDDEVTSDSEVETEMHTQES